MANWISLKSAADKYGVCREDVLAWAEVGEIAWTRNGKNVIIDDESIQMFLSRHRIPPTREYIETLKLLVENQANLCEAYIEVIDEKDRELERKEEVISRLQKVFSQMEESYNQMKEQKS